MTLKEIALKNLVRRKSKAAFILAGLVIGVTTMVAVISLVEAMSSDINDKLERYGANILVVPKTEILPLTYGGMSLGGLSYEMEEIQQEDLARVGSIKNAANVAALGPIVLGVIQVKGNSALLAGVDFVASKILKPWWQVKGTLPGENGVLLGAEAAQVMKLNVGDSVKIKGHEFLVSGVLQSTGSQDDQMFFTRLSTAQFLFGKQGRVSMAEVAALCTACPIHEMVRQISEVLPGAKVMAIQQVVKGRMETLAHFRKFSYGVSGIVLLIGSLVVLVTMMGSIRERTNEIGIFRAIGFRKSHVMHIVFIEAGIVSGLAGFLGYLGGIGTAKIAIRFFSESQAVSVPFNLNLAVGALVLALIVGLASSIYPAIMAARLDPNDALRAL